MPTTRRFSTPIRSGTIALCVGLLTVGLAVGQEVFVEEPRADPRAERVASRLLLPIQVRGRGLDFLPLEDRMAAHRVPAVSVAVIEGGTIQWSRAWGVADVESQGLATPETRFQAASISKPLAALAVLRLVESGRLGLDDDVASYLTGWDVPRADGVSGPVTPRGLLSHTAGLTVHGFTGYRPGVQVPSTLEVLAGSGPTNSPPVTADAPPATVWRYSGGGYTVLQFLVETLQGRPFDVEMRDVLDALGMSASTFSQPLPDTLTSEAAVGYRTTGEAVSGRWHTYPEMAAAGLWSTPTELARYAIAVADWFRGQPDGVLSPEMTRTMLDPGLGGWGLGPSTAGEGLDFRFHHGGSNEGFRAELVYFPTRGLGAVIMTNADGGSPLIDEILAAIAEEYDWPAYRAKEIRALELTASAGRQYAGQYQIALAPDVPVTTRWRSGRLELQIGDANPSELFYVARDRFVVSSDGADVRFERDGNGRVSAMIAYETRARRVRRTEGRRPNPLP